MDCLQAEGEVPVEGEGEEGGASVAAGVRAEAGVCVSDLLGVAFDELAEQ